MANELTVQETATFVKNGQTISISKSKTLTVSGNNAISNVQSVGTTNEAIVVGDTAPGWLHVTNLDATNFVELFGVNDNTIPLAKLLPGQTFKTHLNGTTTIYAKADTAACEVLVSACDL